MLIETDTTGVQHGGTAAKAAALYASMAQGFRFLLVHFQSSSLLTAWGKAVRDDPSAYRDVPVTSV